MEIFRDWFAELPRQPYCLPCLARMYERAESVIRGALADLHDGVEVKNATCWSCLQERETYRLRKNPTR